MKEKDGIFQARSSTPSLHKMLSLLTPEKSNSSDQRSSSRMSLMSSRMSNTSVDLSFVGGQDLELNPEDNEEFEVDLPDRAMDLPKPKGISTVDFMNAVTTHTQMLQNGLRELRFELQSDPLRTTLDLGSEAIILSGLREKCSTSMNHIQKLYEETRFLKTFLEKMEAKANYDLEVLEKQESQGPSLLRKMAFLAALVAISTFVYKHKFPKDFDIRMEQAKSVSTKILEIVLANGGKATQVQKIVLQGQ